MSQSNSTKLLTCCIFSTKDVKLPQLNHPKYNQTHSFEIAITSFLLSSYNNYQRRNYMFDQTTKLCDVKYKIVFLGPSSVGKSAIIERFTRKTFDTNRTETVGVDFITKNVLFEGAAYKLQLWDTAGQEKFKSLVPSYLRDAHCAVFVYDISNKNTFVQMDLWIELFKDLQNQRAVSILVGNKTDGMRQVCEQEAESKAKNYEMSFCQTSAKLGVGVDQLFHSIISNIRVTKMNEEGTNKQVQTNVSNTQNKLNKQKLVRIKKNKKQLACCYI